MYSCDGKVEFSSSLLQCHMVLQKSFKYHDLLLKTFIIIIIIINVENSCVQCFFSII